VQSCQRHVDLELQHSRACRCAAVYGRASIEYRNVCELPTEGMRHKCAANAGSNDDDIGTE
jgi:hypothetical protein